jgi:hypothetical protein
MQRMIFAVAVALAACGGSSGTTVRSASNGKAAAQTGDDVECHEERPLGSSIPRKVCRTRAQNDFDREGGQDYVRKVRPTPAAGN